MTKKELLTKWREREARIEDSIQSAKGQHYIRLRASLAQLRLCIEELEQMSQ